MAKSSNHKLKILYINKILMEMTDEKNGITMSEIISQLAKYDIEAERKSVYSDIGTLREFGVDILSEKRGKQNYYYIGNRHFQIAELKLLVDSIQSAKFMTVKKSNELIKKLESFVSKHEASMLQRQVYVSERIKTINESIYYNVDKIHTAISQNCQIKFKYFQWDMYKNMVPRKAGEFYEVSPWALSWDDENYYLIAFDSDENKIKHFRVDKIQDINLVDLKRDGKDIFEKFDLGAYSKKTFGMFNGEERNVKLLCKSNFAGVIIDRFGKDVVMTPVDEDSFTVNVNVALSKQFFAWVFGLGEDVKIIEPEYVVDKMREEVKRLMVQYGV